MWMLLSWPVSDGVVDYKMIVIGLIASFVVSNLFYEIIPKEHIFLSPVRLFWLLVYVPVFFYYAVKADIDIIFCILNPKLPIKPGIVKVKTELKTSAGITALANSITLTPGTLTVDLTDDGHLYVHWGFVEATDVETATAIIVKRYEWFLLKIFG